MEGLEVDTRPPDPTTATVTKTAALLIGAALALLGFTFADELALDSAAAASSRPTHVGPVTVVWAREPSPSASLRCFVAREPTKTRGGVWLCG